MDYGLDTLQFRKLIVRPALERIGLWSPIAENLVIGTALVESRLRYVKQIGGPAFGLYQMEGPTHADIHRNFLRYNADLNKRVTQLATFYVTDFPDPSEMIANLAYATAMCRVHYRRSKEPLPVNEPLALAKYHKLVYNTPLGKTRVDESVKHFEIAVKEGAV